MRIYSEEIGTSPLPLYVQIKEILKKLILNGSYGPHEKLPSENELMKRFGVSRITVRQALRDLHAEGLVFSSQGKGTFVSKPKAVQDVLKLEGFGEAMHSKGYDTSATVLDINDRCRPPKAVKEAFSLEGNEPVLEIKRIRYLNHKPVSYDISYFPEALGYRLKKLDLTQDIFPTIENQLGIPLGRADYRLEAQLADSSVAKLLEIKSGSPIMWVERLTHDQSGNPVDFEYLHFVGDAYQFHFNVERQHNEVSL